jgi:hypothetical protein
MKRVAYMVEVTAVLATAFFTSSVGAQESQLPKSGTAHVHSGWAGIGEAKEVGKNHLVWLGTYYGTSFNDAGKGLMHKVAWICHGASDILDKTIVLEGFCTTTDADGDQVYGSNRGKGQLGDVFVGAVTFTGGNGKYAGIQGANAYRCNAMGQHGQLFCTNEVSYKLP